MLIYRSLLALFHSIGELMKSTKYISLSTSAVMLIFCVAMLATDFFKPCDQGHGDELSCSISVGGEAYVDQAAKVSLSSDGPFIVEQQNQNGEKITIESIKEFGRYRIQVDTDQPTTWLVTKASGGLHTPMIFVDRIQSDQYPGLTVHRTGYKPLEQLFGWYLIMPFLLSFILFVLFAAYFLVL